MVTVSLDYAGTLLPSLGLEMLFNHAVATSRRWDTLFDYLAALGVCSQQKREILLAMGAVLSPAAPDQSWPAAWAVATALTAAASPRLVTGVSHLKLAFDRAGRPSAKAYVTAQHHWDDPERARQSRLPELQPARSPDDARRRVVDFLLQRCQQNGLWGDYNDYNGGCGTYVSANVAAALANAELGEARACAEAAAPALLRRREGDGGWGHQERAPTDSDTTAAVLKFFATIGDASALIASAQPYLLSHCLDDGGFTLYSRATPISFRTERDDAQRWRLSHLCVAANCAMLLPEQLLPLLRNTQNGDGSWTPYWWRTPSLATVLAAETFAFFGTAPEVVRRAVSWAVQYNADTAFDAFCRVRLLMLGDAPQLRLAAQIMADLLNVQHADGSWGLGADMLFPAPKPDTAPLRMVLLPEDQGVFTAAMALATITAFIKSAPAPAQVLAQC
jgi:hypothetical protein